jgi:hypothetical protein
MLLDAALLDAALLDTALLDTVALQQTPTPTPADEGGQGEDFGKSSPVGFVVLLLFLIAVIFLVRSMNKHLRKVPPSFEEPQSFEEPSQTSDSQPSDSQASTDKAE